MASCGILHSKRVKSASFMVDASGDNGHTFRDLLMALSLMLEDADQDWLSCCLNHGMRAWRHVHVCAVQSQHMQAADGLLHVQH